MTASSKLLMQLAAALVALAPATSAHAQTVTWPAGAPPCNGTLQTCIDAQPPGFQVLVDSDAPTDVVTAPETSLILSKTVNLSPAQGRKPRFPPGLSIVATSLPAGSGVEIEGFTLRDGGNVRIVGIHAVGRVKVAVRRMRFEHIGVAGSGVSAEQDADGELRLEVRDNDFLRTGGAGNFAFVGARAGLLTGELSFNLDFAVDRSRLRVNL